MRRRPFLLLGATALSGQPVVLCADDFAMSPGVSEAVCRLIEDGRLSATSCMTVSSSWPEHASWLKPLSDKADIGLHLTLTEQVPLGPLPVLAPHGHLPALPQLMRAALSRRLDPAEVGAEAHRQVDAFEAAFGRTPDFVDGHQHVHQLPVIREIVLDLARTRLAGAAYLRSCWDAPAAIVRRGVAVPKTLLIASLGLRFRRQMSAAGLRANRSFRGVYDFTGPFAPTFDAFLRDLAPGTLVMCHPGVGEPSPVIGDAIAEQRPVEFEYLRSDAFIETLARRRAAVARFGSTPDSPDTPRAPADPRR